MTHNSAMLKPDKVDVDCLPQFKKIDKTLKALIYLS